MKDKYNGVSDNDLPQLDAEFYSVLGWLSVLSVSMAGWVCNA